MVEDVENDEDESCLLLEIVMVFRSIDNPMLLIYRRPYSPHALTRALVAFEYQMETSYPPPAASRPRRKEPYPDYSRYFQNHVRSFH